MSLHSHNLDDKRNIFMVGDNRRVDDYGRSCNRGVTEVPESMCTSSHNHRTELA